MRKMSHFFAFVPALIACANFLYAEEPAAKPAMDAFEYPQSAQGWLPSGPGIYPALKADPRQVRCSIAYRWDDDALGSNIGMANLGSELMIWRGFDVGVFDSVDVGLTGGVWANFDMKAESMDLMNADWTASIPVSAQMGDLKLRARIYHISCHQGDEYLERPGRLSQRKNPSFEAIELGAYGPLYTDRLYGYGTAGYILESDKSFKMKKYYVEGGLEYFMKDANFKWNALSVEPYAAAHVRLWQYQSYKPGYNAALGLSWKNENTTSRPSLDTSLEYYRGNSLEGQFAVSRTHYVCLQLTYRP